MSFLYIDYKREAENRFPFLGRGGERLRGRLERRFAKLAGGFGGMLRIP